MTEWPATQFRPPIAAKGGERGAREGRERAEGLNERAGGDRHAGKVLVRYKGLGCWGGPKKGRCLQVERILSRSPNTLTSDIPSSLSASKATTSAPEVADKMRSMAG